jgi:hypothetical protein
MLLTPDRTIRRNALRRALAVLEGIGTRIALYPQCVT